VDAPGNYRSPIANVAQRFGTMIGGLTTGRDTALQCREGCSWLKHSTARALPQPRQEGSRRSSLQHICIGMPGSRQLWCLTFSSAVMLCRARAGGSGCGRCHQDWRHHRPALRCVSSAGAVGPPSSLMGEQHHVCHFSCIMRFCTAFLGLFSAPSMPHATITNAVENQIPGSPATLCS
jgi:hypothetical protein